MLMLMLMLMMVTVTATVIMIITFVKIVLIAHVVGEPLFQSLGAAPMQARSRLFGACNMELLLPELINKLHGSRSFRRTGIMQFSVFILTRKQNLKQMEGSTLQLPKE